MKLIILDRDGVINEDSDNYIKSPDEFILISSSIDAIARLTQAEYTIVIATNQSGLARHYYDRATLDAIHEKMTQQLSTKGGKINGIYFCPHGPDDNCDCRKPKTGLLDQIASDYNTTLTNIPFVGDKLSDMRAAQAVGATPYLVKTGKGQRTIRNMTDKNINFDNIVIYNNLLDVTNTLIA